MAANGEKDLIRVSTGAGRAQKSLESLLATLNTLGRATGLAFNASTLVSYSREAMAAAESLDRVWESLARGLAKQGRGLREARSFLEDYTADGLIPLKEAARAYQTLAEKGFGDGQIRQLLAALKDTAAFGRDSSRTLGETVVWAVEKLKEESFALTDSAGKIVTQKDLWDAYAASLGAGADALSQAQKRQAEVNGVLAVTKGQTGEAALAAAAYAGQTARLTASLEGLKASLGQGLAAAAQAALPGINAVISALLTLARVFAQVTWLLFGGRAGKEQAEAQMEIADASQAAAEGTDKLAVSTGKAGKAAKALKSALAGFDELTVLDFGGGSGSGSGGGAAASDVTLPEITPPGELFAGVELSPKLVEFVERLKAAVEPIGETLGAGLRWFYDNVLTPLGRWTANGALPAFLDVLDGGLDAANQAILALKPGALWLWEHFLRPLAAWTGEAFLKALGQIADLLHDLAGLLSGELSFGDFVGQLTPLQTALLSVAAAAGGLTIFKGVKAVISSVTEAFLKLGEAMEWFFGPGSLFAGIAATVGGIVLAFTNFFSMLRDGFSWANEALMALGIALAAVGAIILGAPALITAVIAAIVAAVATAVVVIKEHWEEIKAAFAGVWESVRETWAAVAGWFRENVFTPLAEFFTAMGRTISDVFEGCWIVIQTVWKVVSQWFKANVTDPLANVFAPIVQSIGDAFSRLWENIMSIWSRAGDCFRKYVTEPIGAAFAAIPALVRGVFNGLIGFVEGMINRVVSGINVFLTGFSLAVSKAASFIGVSWGGVALLPGVRLPRLAQGAVIPPNRQFAAILGDQRSGTNIEAPLATIEQAVQNVLDRNGGAGREIHITVESVLDGKVVARNTVKHINDMTLSAGRPVLAV